AEYRAGTRKRIYCFGQVFYDDDFGVGHFTNFGFSIVLDAANKPVAIWTERHNETDRTAPVE
ncbi:MAG TPA: hypothetical protein VGP50_13815, partial [Stellaceae bacterium]|nr:hypothetical protein [Stellaceae bacterium]